MNSASVTKFPEIPRTAKFAILIPTVRWDDKAKSILASFVGVASEDVVVLISDNSENYEKHEFLKKLSEVNKNILYFVHEKNIGALDNFYFLYEWCADIDFSAIMADDDCASPTYYIDAYRALCENASASCISAGNSLVDFGDGQLRSINQPSMVGSNFIERVKSWNGWAARMTMYNVSRRASLSRAIAYLKKTPMQGVTLLENIFELSRLAVGDFCQVPGQGFFVHYPFHGGGGGEESAERLHKFLCEKVGLRFPMIFFMKISTAIQCAIFILGKYSPVAEEEQRGLCARHVFRHLFFDGFIAADLSGDGGRSFLRDLLKGSDDAVAGFDYYCELKDKDPIEFDLGVVRWFLEIVKVFESPAEKKEELLSERFAGFCADALGKSVSDINQAVIPRGSDSTVGDKNALQWSVPDWMNDRAPSAARILAIQTMLQANPDVGTLGVAVIVGDVTDPHALIDTLDSLAAQHRPVDGIWVIGPQTPLEAAGGIVEAVTGDDPWPALLSRRIEQGGMPDFLWILHAGDRLVPHATLAMGEYRLRNPDPLIWYADDVVCDGVKPSNVFLKPDLNIDLLRSYPYTGRNAVVSTVAVQAVGGLDGRVADLSLIDLIWRLVEQTGPGVVGHVPEALQSSKNSLMDWVCNAETMTWFPVVTQTHFERMGLDAQVLPGPMLGLGRVEYPLTTRPLISIIVPTRDRQPILRTCIEGLMERTSYPNYELLIVDNGSVEQDAVDFLAGLERMKMDQVRVLRWPQAFNFAAINNFAVQHARGDVLLFLNNDIQFSPQTRPDWLERLLAHALRPEVGAVGTRLDLPGGRGVDQAGQILGMDNSVGTAFQGLPVSAHGYMRRLLVQQNVSSLSASCMMMRRQMFEELGGFDEEAFPVYYADADLCMKATRAGYLLALEPETGLLHIGGATRLLTKQFGLEARPDDVQRDRLYARWLPQLARDPHYHPALGKVSPGFDLRPDASRIFEPLPGRPLPVVMAVHWDWYGCGYYRVLHPFAALEKELRLEGGLAHKGFHFTDVARVQPDVIVLQGSWLIEGILARIQRYREITGAKVVLEFDDYLPNIPTRSIHRKEMQGVIKKMRRAIEQVDWLVVSTPPLAQEYSDYHDDIRVACNGLSPDWWRGLSGRRRAGKKMRVGWAGASSHAGDLAEIRYVVKELQDEVEWVFMGMKPEGIQCEFHRGTSIVQYPAALASLNLDLAIVPLELNQFNRSKSNLRLLELGACGFPIIATDIEPFRGSLPVELVRNNRHQDWVAAIRAHLADPEALARQGDALRVAIHQNYMLEGSFLDQWAKAWGVAPAAS